MYPIIPCENITFAPHESLNGWFDIFLCLLYRMGCTIHCRISVNGSPPSCFLSLRITLEQSTLLAQQLREKLEERLVSHNYAKCHLTKMAAPLAQTSTCVITLVYFQLASPQPSFSLLSPFWTAMMLWQPSLFSAWCKHLLLPAESVSCLIKLILLQGI